MSDLFTSIVLNDLPLLDVRAPVEFCKGTLPNATNVPLLDDEQRHEVGLTYKNEGQQRAIERGETLIHPQLRDTKLRLWQDYAKQNPDAYLFCFRGGLRSKTSQRWLADSGVELPLIPGGYKAFRQFLMLQLATLCETLDFVLLGGRTGCGKTLLLKHIPSHIDLEGLAHHRGSSFGATTTPQPGNINFENSIATSLLKLHAQKHTSVTLEDEGRMIGSVCIPEAMRNKMSKSCIVLLEEGIETRVQISRQAYIDDLLVAYKSASNGNSAKNGTESGINAFANHHYTALEKITRRFGSQRVRQARELFDSALLHYQNTSDTTAFNDYVELLLVQYYDPMYDYQLTKKRDRVVFCGNADEVKHWLRTHPPLSSLAT